MITAHITAIVPAGLAYFDALGTALARNPPPARDASILRELATVGSGPGRHPSTEHLPAATLAGLMAAAAGGPGKIASLRIGLVLGSSSLHHDGSLDVYVPATPPAGHESNWLPSPASGQFEITMRMYGPKPSALRGTYHYPPITRTG